MDKKYIEESEIEIKYLRNQLTDEELEEFEVYLMENPEVIERLELDATFLTEVDEKNDKSVKSNSWNLVSWLSNTSALFTGLCSVLVFSFTGFVFVSSGLGDKEFELYTVRGQENNKLDLNGQIFWPIVN